MKPTLFIGSSRERLSISRCLQQTLNDCADVTIWDEAPDFQIGHSILDGLVTVGRNYDFSLLVFGQDDSTMMDGVEHSTVRDNVLFELGLLMGHMGRGRAFWISPRGSKAPHLPSDLGGIVHLEFDEPDNANAKSLLESLTSTRDRIYKQIMSLGFRTDRTIHVVPLNRALCLASSQYSQERFQEDLTHIHGLLPPGRVASEQGVSRERFDTYFRPNRVWDIVHLGLYVDKDSQRLVFDERSASDSKKGLDAKAIAEMIKICRAQLVLIVTCDSLAFAEQMARFTSVIAGLKKIDPADALHWSRVFYESLAAGFSLSRAFDTAQDRGDPGLVLLSRGDIRFSVQPGATAL